MHSLHILYYSTHSRSFIYPETANIPAAAPSAISWTPAVSNEKRSYVSVCKRKSQTAHEEKWDLIFFSFSYTRPGVQNVILLKPYVNSFQVGWCVYAENIQEQKIEPFIITHKATWVCKKVDIFFFTCHEINIFYAFCKRSDTFHPFENERIQSSLLLPFCTVRQMDNLFQQEFSSF